MAIAKEIKDKVGEDPAFEKRFEGNNNIKLKLENLVSQSGNMSPENRMSPRHHNTQSGTQKSCSC